VLLRSRENRGASYTHIHEIISLSLSRMCVVCACNIYAHYTPHSAASAIETRLSISLCLSVYPFLFLCPSLFLSLSHSLSISPSPIICVRKSSSGAAAEKSKRNVVNTGLTTITINTVLYTRGPLRG